MTELAIHISCYSVCVIMAAICTIYVIKTKIKGWKLFLIFYALNFLSITLWFVIQVNDLCSGNF